MFLKDTNNFTVTKADTLTTARTINGTSFNGSANITTANWGTARSIYIADNSATNTGPAVSVNGSGNATLKLPATIKATTFTGALSGNATTATTLATARTINGTSFNGSANITTANWGTARNIYIADNAGSNTCSAVSVNGSGNATLKLPATIAATISGNATTATKLQTARTITLKGRANGSASFDGSSNITIDTIPKMFEGGGTSGTSGYVAVAQLKITGTYANRPTDFKLVSRGRGTTCTIRISKCYTYSTSSPSSS